VLHHYLGWSQPEIAHALEIPIGTVKSRLFYATRALRSAIEADDRPTPVERPA
jgi:DNA-directed RNA polymerase specialized sigma24 family protein